MNYKIRKGENILEDVEKILNDFSVRIKDSVVFYGSEISKKIYNKYLGSFKGYEIKGGNIFEKDRIKGIIREFGYTIGIGGGKILDTVKLASGELNVPFISIPSTLSNDGIFSPVSVLKDNNEVRSIITNPPEILIIDYSIVLDSPSELLLSGVGDLVSNISALIDWEIATKKGKSEFNEEAYSISLEGAKKILYTDDNLNSINFIDNLAEGLIKSGIAMRITKNSRPASGAEHLISHALDKILEKPRRHGIQCGFATIFTLNIHNYNDLESIITLYKGINFPVKFGEIGFNKNEFLKAVEYAPKTRPERYTILNEIGKNDILEKINILL